MTTGKGAADAAPRVFTWDWKAQPPMEDIAAAVRDMSARGQVFMAEADTQQDQYAWVIASEPLTGEQATAAYDSMPTFEI